MYKGNSPPYIFFTISVVSYLYIWLLLIRSQSKYPRNQEQQFSTNFHVLNIPKTSTYQVYNHIADVVHRYYKISE